MYRYIIVDDEYITRKGILKKVESFSFPIECLGEADNGEDALILVSQVHPDIIITDMNMPTMDGPKFLKELNKQYPHIKVLIISGYTDFNYMQEAIAAGAVTYLLKPFTAEELEAAFNKAIAQLDDDKLLLNKIHSYETIQTNILYQNDIYLLSKLIHKTNNKSNYAFESQLLQTLSLSKHYLFMTLYLTQANDYGQFENYIQQSAIHNKCVCFQNEASFNMVFVVYFYNKNDHILGVNALNQIIKGFYSEVNYNIFAGISKEKSSLMELNQAHRETIHALNSRKIAGIHNYTCFSYEDVSTSKPLVQWEKADELLFFMENGNSEQVSVLLSELFRYFTASETLNFEQLKSFCSTLALNTRSLLERYFDSISSNTLSSSLDAIVDTLFDINEIQDYFTLLFMNVTSMLASNNRYKNENIIEKIKIYISINYDKILTLDKISNLFFINPSYCSTLFKEKTGENFIDYINQVRIEKAKEFLTHTNYKVYQIAKSVGFDNPKYFFSVFKKVTGETPEKFRNHVKY